MKIAICDKYGNYEIKEVSDYPKIGEIWPFKKGSGFIAAKVIGVTWHPELVFEGLSEVIGNVDVMITVEYK